MIQLGVEGMWIEVLVIGSLSLLVVVMLRSIDKDSRDERNKWGDDT